MYSDHSITRKECSIPILIEGLAMFFCCALPMKFGIPMAIKRHFLSSRKKAWNICGCFLHYFWWQVTITKRHLALPFNASRHLKQKAKCFCLRSWSAGNFSSKIFFVACAIMARLISVAPKMLLRVGIFWKIGLSTLSRALTTSCYVMHWTMKKTHTEKYQLEREAH